MPLAEKAQGSIDGIRVAGAPDVQALVALVNAAFAVERVVIEGDRVNRTAIEKFLQTGNILLLEENDTALGCVYLEKRDERGYLGLLSVDPSLQSHGLGQKLVFAAEKYAREHGCKAMDLRVLSARAEILPFYEKCGYRVTGTSPVAPEVPLKTPCHYIHMAKPLS
jgi:GNAT superfamily N-acetyltransferase